MTVRKSLSRLTPPERDAFLAAVLTLKNTILNPGTAQEISLYDQFVATHYGLTRFIQGGSAVDLGHGVAWFLSWHRQFLVAYESALQAVDPQVALPYWDWSDHTGTGSVVFQDNFMGPDGSGGSGSVASGYFAFNAPAVPPAWWPAGLLGWRIRADLDTGPDGSALARYLGNTANLATVTQLQTTLNNGTAVGFWQALEGGPRMHNSGHNWVGGHMWRYTSPNDPIFFCHHANVDRLWAMWQIDGHQGAAFFPNSAGLGSDLISPMWPWDGGAGAVDLPANVTAIDVSGDPPVTTTDTLDHRAMGYSYDTEPVVGVLLDRSGSMLGPTPHPITGAGNVTKWEAATLGVQHFLQDCEAAYTAKEAYVTAGVSTFTTAGASNTFVKVFPAPHFGLVKNGGAIDAAGFNANIAGLSPAGATPIGGGLLDTEATLVRPPFADQPSGEQRYMCVLTDGHENRTPLLASLATPEFPDTVVFAMGFGIGGAVSYAMINDVVGKGKSVAGTQVFHGETAGEIDKFYANSVAEAIGYTPMVDPTVELFPGEFAMIPFWVNDLDNHLMITVQGHNRVDEDWQIELMAPTGEMFMGAVGAPVTLSTTKREGRATMFLKLRDECCDDYVGRWHVIVKYRVTPEMRRMVMPSTLHLLKPSGALPLHGQIYSAKSVPPARRRLHRGMLFREMGFPKAVPPGKAPNDKDPSAVTVQVYTKHRWLADLTVPRAVVRSGETLELGLDVARDAAVQVHVGQVLARLVAPAFSIGAALADTETISLRARRKFVRTPEDGKEGEVDTESTFDLDGFLGAYEVKQPGFFAVRDEEIEVSRDHPSQGLARVETGVEGVYKFGVSVEGEVEFADGRRQRFSRVLERSAFVIPDVDPEQSKATLHWLTRNRFVLDLRVRGADGVPINPLSVEGTVHFGKTAVAAESRIQPDGALHLAGTLPRKLKVSERGTVTEDGRRARPVVSAAGRSIPIGVPRFVGSKSARKLFEAGTTKAKKIDLGDREVFDSVGTARNAGYER